MKKKKSAKRLFYRNAPYLESLVFAPPKMAEYNSAIHHALVASTWGEFKAIIPVKEYKPLLQRLREGQYYLETDDAHDADKHHTLPQSNEAVLLFVTNVVADSIVNEVQINAQDGRV